MKKKEYEMKIDDDFYYLILTFYNGNEISKRYENIDGIAVRDKRVVYEMDNIYNYKRYLIKEII